MKRFISAIATFALVLAATFLLGAPALAETNAEAICKGSGGTWRRDSSLPNKGECSSADGSSVVGTIQQLTDVLIFLVGAIAVLMIIIGAIRYVISAGDQAATSSAKNTVMYALIGLGIAFSAYAIVHFVYASFNIK